jgi:aryl-alcohol dehydrogenase-like predicted oxidoreductase
MTETRTLGATGIKITPIGLGTWQLSEGKGGAAGTWAAVPESDANAVIRAAFEGGINWFDTAELYGYGRSERALARGLQRCGARAGNVVVATKWIPLFRTAGSIKATIARRLDCLAPYGIDLHQVHFPASFSSVEAEMHAMADLIDAGKIRAAGVSNFSASQMRRAHATLVQRGYRLASNQVKYSPLDRRIERNGVLAAAKELETTIIAYSPLEMGLLSGKFHKDAGLLDRIPWVRRVRLRRLVEKSRGLVELLETIAAAHQVSASQVVLNWVVNFHGKTVVTIPGATKENHARESAGALSFTLSREEMAAVNEKCGVA